MKKLSAIKWYGPETGPRERKLVSQVLKSNYLNDGDITREFESKVGKFLGTNYCVAVPNGTTAIVLGLMGMGIGPGDEVIVPDLTFIATANAARLTGATVKLVDIDPVRLTMDVEQLKKAITSRTRAIVPVDVNGRGADYINIIKLAKKHGLVVVCDSAEALGSKYNGKFLGTYGDAGCFSFSPNKTITTGQGGIVVTNNQQLYFRMRELKDQGRRFQGTGGDDKHPVMGYNFKFTNVQAAIGLAQLERLRKRLEGSKQRDRLYRDYLQNVDGIEFPSTQYGVNGEILQWTDILVDKKEKISKALEKHSIGHRAFWFPIHTQIPYLQKDKNFSNTISVSRRGLWLPSAFNITPKQIEHVSGVIKKALAQKG